MISEPRNDNLILVEKAQTGDDDACNTLVIENSPLIWSIVRRFTGRGVDIDDLYQIGCLGFVKAVRGFDPSFGTQFSTYAVPKIIGEIRRYLRDDGMIKVDRKTKDKAIKIAVSKNNLKERFGREPKLSEISSETGFSIEEIAVCESASMQVDSLQREMNDDDLTLENFLGGPGIEDKIIENVTVSEAIKSLPERERKIVYLRFFKGLTQMKTAQILNISQVQVSRIERKAIKVLKEAIG